jgi:hypothetical protein
MKRRQVESLPIAAARCNPNEGAVDECWIIGPGVGDPNSPVRVEYRPVGGLQPLPAGAAGVDGVPLACLAAGVQASVEAEGDALRVIESICE